MTKLVLGLVAFAFAQGLSDLEAQLFILVECHQFLSHERQCVSCAKQTANLLEEQGAITREQEKRLLLLFAQSVWPPGVGDDFVHCNACLKKNCPAEFEACQNDEACQCILDCTIENNLVNECSVPCGISADEADLLINTILGTCDWPTLCPSPEFCQDFHADN